MKTRMMRLLYGHKIIDRMDAIDFNERIARRTHVQNIKAIVNAQETADNLKKALQANHISIQIFNAMKQTGKNNATPHKSQP